MRRRTLVAVTVAAAFWIAPAAYAHDVNPPNGGRGDTPFNSGNPNAGKNFGTALENGQAENALLRAPPCGAHGSPDGIHPPGNP